jgi:hypothetical protein
MVLVAQDRANPGAPMQQGTTIQPPPPPPPLTELGAPQMPVRISQPGSPREVYQAVQAKREVLGEYMNRLLNRRNNVAERLTNPRIEDAEKDALEEHLKELNTRIIDMEKQLHKSDAEVAAAAGIPGATASEPRPIRNGPPDGVAIIGTIFGGIAMVILAVAFARRLWKGTTKVVSQIPGALEARLTRFEQSIDAVAIEIERVSEGQRFLTKVLSEQNPRAIGAGPAQPIETRAGVADPVRRG